MLFEENGKLIYIAESRTLPDNRQLWNKALQIARMDKDYNPTAARIITKRVYQMMGGKFKIKGKPKRKTKK